MVMEKLTTSQKLDINLTKSVDHQYHVTHAWLICILYNQRVGPNLVSISCMIIENQTDLITKT
jgi:hypothetical protein